MKKDAPVQMNQEEQAARRQSDMTRMERIRRRRKMRKIRLIGLCVLLLAGVLAYFTGVYGASLAVLGDVLDSITIALTPSAGYPANFNISGFVQADTLAGGFVALGDRDVAIYAANGNEVRRMQHGYARPAMTVGNTRVCIYSRAGTQLRVESRSRTLYTHDYDEALQLAAMSPNGTLAVLTKTQLTVYDPMDEPILWWKTNDSVTAMTFSSDNRHFAVGSLNPTGGALGGTIYIVDTRSASVEPDVVLHTADGIPLQMNFITRQQLLVVYDTFAAVYAVSTGEQLYRYDYGARTLQSASLMSGKNTVLLFGDTIHTAVTSLAILDDTLTCVGEATVYARGKTVAATRTGAYVITNESVLAYALDGAFYGEIRTATKPLTVLAGTKDLLLTEKHVNPVEKPSAQEPASSQAASFAQESGAVSVTSENLSG